MMRPKTFGVPSIIGTTESLSTAMSWSLVYMPGQGPLTCKSSTAIVHNCEQIFVINENRKVQPTQFVSCIYICVSLYSKWFIYMYMYV